MRELLVVAAAMLFAGSASGQEPREAVPAEGMRDDIALAIERGSRMTVPVSIGDQGPFDFIIDTGAERTVVSRELATKLALPFAGAARVHSIARTVPVDLVHVASLGISAHRAHGLRAPTLPSLHMGGVGLIGIDSLQQQRVMIDFERRIMSIEPSAVREKIPARGDDIVVQARSRAGRLVVMDAHVEGIRTAVILDTGSQISLGNAALGAKLKERRSRRSAFDTTLHDVTGAALPAHLMSARELRVGGVGMRDLTIAIADAPVFGELALADRPAMLLGMDAMRLFRRVSIDFKRRRARFLLPERSGTPLRVQLASAG